MPAPRRFPFDQPEFPGARPDGRTKPNQRAECGECAPTAVKAIGLTADAAAAGIWWRSRSDTCPATAREGGGRARISNAVVKLRKEVKLNKVGT